MTSDHYQTLGIAPASDQAVIRAAYRALMRRYHPDANPDPQAQERAREITAAFAVLGNPARRAAWSASRFTMRARNPLVKRGAAFPPWLDEGSRGPPPLRTGGIAAVALALALSVAVAMWPAREAPPRRPPAAPAASAPSATSANSMPPLAPVVEKDPAVEMPVAELVADAAPVMPQQSARMTTTGRLPPPPEPVPARAVEQPPTRRIAPPQAAPRSTREVAAPRPAPVTRTARPEQAERLAAGFLKQSLTHADSTKQQLLLSAQVRSRTSRNLCRSDDCVTDVYLRQMRETTAIMEGRVPGQ